MTRPLIRLVVLAAGISVATAGCTLDTATNSSGDVVDVVIGYQSKTINTVTAGTLLRAKGFLERRLSGVTDRTGTEYKVNWQDYDTGRRSRRRWSPRRSTSARWVTIRC